MSEGYMVFVEGGGVPKVVHETRDIAIKEAERLARNHPYKPVKVLRIVSEMYGEVNVKGVDYD